MIYDMILGLTPVTHSSTCRCSVEQMDIIYHLI